MAQVGPVARQSLLRQAPKILWQAENLQKPPAEQQPMPEWLKRAEEETRAPEAEVTVPKETNASSTAQSATVDKKRVDGVRYNLWVGTQLPLYSSSEQETTLRNMHEPNHRELAISKYAARVADMLWPRVQDDVDEAIAKSKEMQSKKRIGVEVEEEYVPPEVPHVLPVSNWIRNSKELRESFICDNNTRYKPRMAWYNPNDGMIPSGWFTEGLLADLAYYKPFTGLREAHQKWQKVCCKSEGNAEQSEDYKAWKAGSAFDAFLPLKI